MSRSVDGVEEFAASIAIAPAAHQADLRRLYEWVQNLVAEGLVRPRTIHGAISLTLQLRQLAENNSLVSIRNRSDTGVSMALSVLSSSARAPSHWQRLSG